jgi:hypothetical protein
MAKGKEGKERPGSAGKTAKAPGSKIPAPRPAQAERPARVVAAMDAQLSPEQVYKMIQETAYFKAKARQFAPGHEVQDWIEAEAEVRMRLENRA